jgi:hypothetical protein
MSARASIICIFLVCVVSPPLVFPHEVTLAEQPDTKQSQSTEPPDRGRHRSSPRIHLPL